MNYLTLEFVILIITVITIAVSFLAGILYLANTPANRLTFSDKRQKSKILTIFKLR